MPRTKRRATEQARNKTAVVVGVVAGLAIAALVGWLFARPSKRPNLLLVTIDTLRADRVGAYGYRGAETPVMDGLARRGVRFANAQSSVPLTGPAHSTIFTGQYPPVHGVRDNVVFPLGERHPTMATLLKKRGYRTAGFAAAYPVAGSNGFRQGFDHYNEEFHETPIGDQAAERPGNEVADRAIEWLSRQGEDPFFAWVHFYDPHAPYAPPPPYRERFAGRLYDGEVAFADAQLGRILEVLRRGGHDQDTVVAVMADHGEALGEHGEATHAVLVYQSTLHVPFVLAGPGVPAGLVVERRVGLTDVLPTVLGILGIEAPAGLAGRDLRLSLRGQRLADEPLYAESLFGRLNCRWSSLRVWVSADWKLIQGVEPELFNLAEDPGETTNLAARDRERVARMQAALHAYLRKIAPSGDAARPVALSPEHEERLRSLGYVGGGGGAGDLDEPGLPDPRTHVHDYERIQRALTARGPALEPAIAELSSIVEVDGGNPFAHFALGSLAYREGRLGLAARSFSRAVDLDPERPGMRLPYGRLLREMGHLEESERQLRIALEQTTPDDDRTPLSLAETLIDLGRAEEAQKIIDPVLTRIPDHVDALAAKARLLIAQGRGSEAVPYLQKAAEGPELDPWVELGELYLSLGQPEKARASAGQALARANHPWALAVVGRALILEGRRDEGVATLEKALALRPRRPEAWLSLARAFTDAGQAREAALCRREAEAARRV